MPELAVGLCVRICEEPCDERLKILDLFQKTIVFFDERIQKKAPHNVLLTLIVRCFFRANKLIDRAIFEPFKMIYLSHFVH